MVKGLVGSLPVLGVHSFVDVADDFLVALHEIEVLARFVFPGIAMMLGEYGKGWKREKKGAE